MDEPALLLRLKLFLLGPAIGGHALVVKGQELLRCQLGIKECRRILPAHDRADQPGVRRQRQRDGGMRRQLTRQQIGDLHGFRSRVARREQPDRQFTQRCLTFVLLAHCGFTSSSNRLSARPPRRMQRTTCDGVKRLTVFAPE